MEAKNKSELLKDGSDYISEEGVGQPIIYKRKQVNLPDLSVYYFPIKKDSTISYILYEWQDKESQSKPLNELKPYLLKYNELLNEITARYGKSKGEGSLDDLSLIEPDGLRRTDNWANDTTDIEMYIVLSNKHLVQGNMSITPTHTIRLYIRNPTPKKAIETLSQQKINKLDSLVKLFLADICSGKLNDSRQYLGVDVATQVKDEQLNSLKQAIKDDKWELNTSGIQSTLTGKSYINLRYARKDDTNKPPLQWLSILFDEDDKIVGLQPLARVAAQ